MKGKIFFSTIFSLCMFTATAQHQLSGTINDGAAPVSFATVALLRSDSTVVTGVMAGDDGKFVLTGVAAGEYIVRVSFIGYENAYRRVNVPAQSDLGDIIIAESATRMEEVVVTAVRPLVVMRADRYVVNVSGNIQSAGRDAIDILRNTPGVLVDHKGNISVMGNNVQVWIDGRPSRMSGEQLQAFLASMQGGEIDRIEVITNPSSRFEAEGSGGIIDIRTRRGLQFGVNGTITAGYRQGRTDSQNAGVNMNWRREKFNVFGNYSIFRSNAWENINQINVLQTPFGEVTLNQHTTAKVTKARLHNSVRAGMDYFINPNNTLGVIVNAYYSSGGTGSITGFTDISPALNGVSHSTADNTQTQNVDGVQLNTNYQSTFATPGQQLNFDLDYARFYSNSFQKNANRYFDSEGVQAGAIEQFSNANPQTINVYAAKVDYMQPLWTGARVETGARFGHTVTDNNMKYEEVINNVWQVVPGKTNRFEYTEQISAAYVNLNQMVGKFNLQAGLRGEYTYSKGNQKTTNALNDTTYFNLFPTFFVNYQTSPRHTFGLSYSRRLSRPNFWNLNPFEVTIDAYSFVRGNPYLTPAYTHQVQLTHTFAQSLMSRIGYSSTTDLISQAPVVYIDDESQRTGLIFQNFGRSQNISAMMNYRKTLLKIWTANLTVQGAYVINSSNVASGEFVSEGEMLIVQMNNNIVITPSLSAELSGMYVSGVRQGYLVMQSFGNVSIGLRQMLLQNKMTLSLTVSDIFKTMGQTGYARYENVNYSLNVNQDSRHANLTLRYNFGSATVRAARSRQTGIEDEATRAGGR